ncbi:hypothetical protein E2F92_08175 [Micrococcus aloeverae]|nr:hypothetical protein E2F92_08175 [Micrococcus aloeverae]
MRARPRRPAGSAGRPRRRGWRRRRCLEPRRSWRTGPGWHGRCRRPHRRPAPRPAAAARRAGPRRRTGRRRACARAGSP